VALLQRRLRLPKGKRLHDADPFEQGGDIWFALDETRPLACFAGIWTNWTSVRKVKEGETINDLYAFLTTEPNAEVGAVHAKTMPVILTTSDEAETWMTAPPDEAIKLQRPLPNGALRIVARKMRWRAQGR
jgi:putative SOS response-associated peptidase YedK